MDPALSIFLNGVTGVFAGMVVLYITIRLISAFAGNVPEKKEK